MVHYTSYFFAAGIPLSLLIGAPISSICDLVFGVALPVHFHLGMRSVLIDYVHDVPVQRMALGALAIFTAGSALGLTLFNINDVGITEGVKQLFIEQPEPAAAGKKA